MSASGPKVTITETGSTNTAGIEVTLDDRGNAQVQSQAETPRQVKLDASVSAEFVKAVNSAGPLHALPAGHCMKSASFGSSMFIGYKGDRSPDLSCPASSDTRTADLKKMAEEILGSARKAAGFREFRRVIE